jgi:hypothetical protein
MPNRDAEVTSKYTEQQKLKNVLKDYQTALRRVL